MNNWLGLIRYKNLLIVFLTQLLVWYCLLYGNSTAVNYALKGGRDWIPGGNGVNRVDNFIYILLLGGSTVCIAAAGYIINDYFDLKIDIINRPEKMILEKRIPLRTAIIAHTLLNIIGFGMAAVLARAAGHYEWLLIQLTCTVLLWFYSTHFKRQFVTGNVVVALLTALTVVVLLVYSPIMWFFIDYKPTISFPDGASMINPLWMCYGYTFFAFVTTWMREIVKDMEDYKGDAEEGCVTMPIKMGLGFSVQFTQALGIIAILALAFACGYLFVHNLVVMGTYLTAIILAPLVWWCFYLAKKNTVAHYHDASKWLKVIMVAGISSLIVYYFSIPHNI